MSETTANPSNNKRLAAFVSVSLLAAFAAGGLVFAVIERFRDAADRTT